MEAKLTLSARLLGVMRRLRLPAWELWLGRAAIRFVLRPWVAAFRWPPRPWKPARSPSEVRPARLMAAPHCVQCAANLTAWRPAQAMPVTRRTPWRPAPDRPGAGRAGHLDGGERSVSVIPPAPDARIDDRQ